PHPAKIVWEVLSDPAKVVACIDGSELGDQHDDGSFDAKLTVRFAAIKVPFSARVTLDLDDVEHIGTLVAHGSDSRGSTRVQSLACFTVAAVGAGSEVVIDGDVDITGQLASLITTGANVVVDRMTRSFAEELTQACAEQDPATRTAALERSAERGERGFVAWLRRCWQHVRSTFGSNAADRRADA
ncbi:MAG: SRPBCC domain-containing protein, partial [Actinomycetes bacterium]